MANLLGKKVYAVSYTHLDVYKRQCVRRGIPAEVANSIFDDMSSFASYAFNKSHSAAYAAVSYTHLDVYKRQPKRVANMYEEIFAGLDSDPHRLLKVFDEVDNDEMVVVRDIPM